MNYLIAIALWALSFSPVYAAGFVGNAYGVEGKYQIFEFTAAGHALRPVSGTSEAAWPSAITIGTTTTVYGSELVSGVWSNIRRWTSVSGAAYTDTGAVFTAGAGEPYGIGPATVTYDGSLYRLFYLIRGSTGPGTSIGLATSTTGTSFTRVGVIYTAGTEAPGGLAVSYACTDDSTSYIVFHGYSTTLTSGTPYLISSTTPSGTYSSPQALLSPSAVGGTVTGTMGNAFASFTGTMTIGHPTVVNGTKSEVYIPTETIGSTVYFDRPLDASYSATADADFVKSKADVSFIQKLADGTWTGGVTGYGQFSSVTSEYTARITAPSVTGTWTIGSGYLLNPYFNSGEKSTENPEPIRTDSSCS